MAAEESHATSLGPVPAEKLTEIATQACKSAFETAQGYDHGSTTSWNTSIINAVLQSLLSETSQDGKQPQYKFAVTSTIIQHTSVSEAANAPDGTAGGKRGMHSATGAFWNSEKDGMWSHKHEEDEKGLDVIISVIWISVV